MGGLVGGTMFLSRPKYSSDGLISLLQEVFQNMTLKEAHTNVIVPAFELTKKQVWIELATVIVIHNGIQMSC